MTLERILIDAVEHQGIEVWSKDDRPYVNCGIEWLQLDELAEYLSAHVVVGGKSKEQIT